MHLLDTPNKTGNHYLDELLFPLPIEFPHVDCYVPVSDSERWRTYIDSDAWEPEKHNKDLLSRREYHARSVWEASMLLSFTDIDWVSTDTIIALRDVGHLELRITEIEIVSYQLTCGMVGIGARERQKLYHCATNLFMCNMYMSKILESKKSTLVKLENLKPSPSDSKKDLCKQIDLSIFGAHQLLTKGLESMREKRGHELVAELSEKLKRCIISLDEVLVIQ
jgi:hypothetical protein